MQPSKYQRFRLWSGITGIGLNLAMVWAAYVFALFLSEPLEAIRGGWIAVAALGVALVFTLAMLPFDILVGHAAESAMGRVTTPLRDWLKNWFQNLPVFLFGTTFGISLFAWAAPAAWGATWVALGVVALLAVLVIVSIPKLINRTASIGSEPELEEATNNVLRSLDAETVQLRVVEDGGQEGVNGMMMPFRPGTLYINRAAAENLQAHELALLTLRERGFQSSGGTATALIATVGWVITGCLLAMTLPGGLLPANHPLQHGLGGIAVLTSWCFLSLFIWPPVSRRSMLIADGILCEKAGLQETMDLLTKLQDLNDTDTTLQPAKHWVFHPIPSLDQRLRQLERTTP